MRNDIGSNLLKPHMKSMHAKKEEFKDWTKILDR